MLKTEEWAQGKPDIIVMGAPQLVNALNLYFDNDYETITNSPPIEELIKYPSTKTWISFYYKNKHIANYLINSFKIAGGPFALMGDFIEFLFKLPSKENPSEYNSREDYFSDLHITQDDIKSNLHDSPPILKELLDPDFLSTPFPPEVEKAFQQPEMLFIYKVFLPCIFLYNNQPGFILRKARSGDVEALENLLRLDKSIIFDSRISEQIIQASRSPHSKTFDRLITALKGMPKGKSFRLKAKNTMAGLISILSEAFGHKLSAQDIKTLFDALAVDSGKHDLIDPDLPLSPEAFIKNVQRARQTWQFIL